MKRSFAPSILAEKKRLKMLELGLTPEPVVTEEVAEKEHNQSALDVFVALLRKLSASTSPSPEENEDEDDDDSMSEDAENDVFFAVSYAVRQGSRRQETPNIVEQGEGIIFRHSLLIEFRTNDCEFSSLSRAEHGVQRYWACHS